MVKTGDKHGDWPRLTDLVSAVLNAYSQIFFSDRKVFGLILMLVTFMFPLSGLAGLTGVLLVSLVAFRMGFDRQKTIKGLWGFNVLLTTLPLGLFYEPGLPFWVLVLIVTILTFMITVSIQGIFLKYQLPYLSLPFVFVMWVLILSTRQFEALQINNQNIYQLNELYGLGGTWLVSFYEWFQSLELGQFVETYFTSLSAIFFQNSLAGGILIATGLLIASRISFVLSLLGFSAAYGFYALMGLGISEADYTYIGFNFMLTAIAVGGFYNIPTRTSFWWVLLLTPIVAIFTIGFKSLLANWQLSIYALPFNVTTILFVYMLKWRHVKGLGLHETPVQRNSPEKNLYSFLNYQSRFSNHKPFQVSLPFYGEWLVSQGHDGEITHRGDWRHAWDFVLAGEDGKTYRNQGIKLADFLAYDKPVLSPVDGYVVEVVDGVPDNPVGQVNLKNNWGNTVIIKIAEDFYAKISHLKKGSPTVKKGEWVYRGSQLGTCGNSGRSPEPHIHFQLQETPFIESPTLEYPIAYFMTKKGQQQKSQSFAYPKEGEWVSNPEPVPVLRKVFDFIPGQRLNLEYTSQQETTEAEWEVKTTPFNETFLECRQSGSKAFYQLDGQVLYFVHFEGNRQSPLYLFYLAFFQRPLFYGRQTFINDRFPPNQVFKGFSMLIQDLLAPFFIYHVGKFETNLPEKKELFGNDEVQLKTIVKRCILEQSIKSWDFNILINQKGWTLRGTSDQQEIELKWENTSS